MTNIQPGWYQDPAGGTGKRWWDGTQWTDHVAESTSTEQPARVSIDTNTPFIWIFAVLPLFAIVTVLVMNPRQYMENAAHPNPSAPLAVLTPGYFASVGVSLLIWVASIVLALLDYRVLARRGMPRPFHWAWTFLTAWAYVIGRAVVVGRRTGQRDIRSLVLFIVVTVVSSIVTFAVLLNAVFAATTTISLNGG